jgi:hypothetical protein
MQAGVDDQPSRTKQLCVQHAEQAFGIAFIPAVFRDQLFRVQRPSF